MVLMEAIRLVMCFRALILVYALSLPLRAANPFTPVTVCEVLSNLAAHEGKDLAVLGRYSFRKDGLWISQQACGTETPTPPVLWLVEDSSAAPKPPDDFELDAAALNRKFAEMLKHTALGKFRFGTPDYDRWAVVYGRLALRKGNDAAKAPADLVFRGSGVVIFLTTEH